MGTTWCIHSAVWSAAGGTEVDSEKEREKRGHMEDKERKTRGEKEKGGKRGKNLIHKRFNQFGSKYNCVDWLGKHFSNVHALGSISLRSVPDWETVAEAGSASHGEAPIA